MANNVLTSEDGIYSFPLIIGNTEVEVCSTTPKHVNSTQQVLAINKGDDPKMLSKLKTIQFMRKNRDEYYFSNSENEHGKSKVKGKESRAEKSKSNDTKELIEFIKTAQQLSKNPNIEPAQILTTAANKDELFGNLNERRSHVKEQILHHINLNNNTDVLDKTVDSSPLSFSEDAIIEKSALPDWQLDVAKTETLQTADLETGKEAIYFKEKLFETIHKYKTMIPKNTSDIGRYKYFTAHFTVKEGYTAYESQRSIIHDDSLDKWIQNLIDGDVISLSDSPLTNKFVSNVVPVHC